MYERRLDADESGQFPQDFVRPTQHISRLNVFTREDFGSDPADRRNKSDKRNIY